MSKEILASSERRLNEKCGVFAIYDETAEAARVAYPAMWSLQHRGQESSGIATSDGEQILVHKGMGLVAQVYREEDVERLAGHIGIGHVRYSTSKSSELVHAQPVVRADGRIVLAHNGNLPTTEILEEFLKDHHIYSPDCNDSEMMADAVAYFYNRGATLSQAVSEAYPLFTGAFSMALMDRTNLVLVRDSSGIRPFSMGRFNGGWVAASETCAFDTIGASYERDVEPGEMVVINASGVESVILAQGNQKLDLFEFVYFARPDSYLLGKNVHEVRMEAGRRLALEHNIHVDMIVPVPNSSMPFAEGFSYEAGVPLIHALVKNGYINRTFIQPDQKLRDHKVRMKYNVIAKLVKGKDVGVFDDSIVRASTAGPMIELFRLAGANSVSFLVGSPPVKFPDFYGIDTPEQRYLIAAEMSVEETRRYINADYLGYLSLEGLIEATELPREVFNTSCFTGEYPIDIGQQRRESIVGL